MQKDFERIFLVKSGLLALLYSFGCLFPFSLFAAPKISVHGTDKLSHYNKLYVLPIRNDFRGIQPKLVERLKKAGFDLVDLKTEHLPFASQGTGFLLGKEGQVLTCAHVVGKEPEATLWIEGIRYVGHVTAIDTNLDCAMIQVQGDHPPFRRLGFGPDSSGHLGQEVLTMGFPIADVLGSKPRLNKGAVSSTSGLEDNPLHLQISTPIQPGNSGGPLLDSHGEVIGMVDSTINPLRILLLEGEVPQNVNFAIKAMYLRKFLQSANYSMPQEQMEAATNSSGGGDDLFENIGKSLALVRGGLVDEKRLQERPLLCRCFYTEVIKAHFFRMRIDFIDLKKLTTEVKVNLDESSTASEETVLNSMSEHICDKFFPDRINPFNPKKSKTSGK